MKCTELLEKDHRAILRGLDILDEMSEEVKAGNPVDSGDVESIVRFLRVFEDEHHQAKEESALFPALIKASGGQNDKLRQMLFEHDQERSLVDGLEEALKTRRGADFVHFAKRITALLRAHINKEEFALFSLIELSLSSEQDGSVVAEFARFDELLERGEGAGVLDALSQLESKYLRRRSA